MAREVALESEKRFDTQPADQVAIVNMHSNEGSNTAHCLGEYMKIIQVSLGKRTHWEEVLKR